VEGTRSFPLNRNVSWRSACLYSKNWRALAGDFMVHSALRPKGREVNGRILKCLTIKYRRRKSAPISRGVGKKTGSLFSFRRAFRGCNRKRNGRQGWERLGKKVGPITGNSKSTWCQHCRAVEAVGGEKRFEKSWAKVLGRRRQRKKEHNIQEKKGIILSPEGGSDCRGINEGGGGKQ